VDVSAQLKKNYELFESFEENGKEKLQRYLSGAEEKYELAIKELMYKDYKSLFDFVNRKFIREITQLNIFESLDHFVSRYFESEEAKQIVEYSVGFLGSSPMTTPAFYHIMTYIDFKLGVWYPTGGMGKVAQSIYELARVQGAEFKFNEEVRKINVSGKRAESVVTDKEEFDADVVLVNADYPHAETQFLERNAQSYSEKYWEKSVLAPSAFCIYLGVDSKIPELEHHTLFLDKDWATKFDAIFDPKKAEWAESPSFYVNTPSKTDRSFAPKGGEALFILVPLSPHLEDTKQIRQDYYNRMLDHLEKKIGQNIRDHIVVKKIFAHNDFSNRYNAYKGTALGLSHTLKQTALFRPAHKSKKVTNLYYTGQYTHPGIGVPMALISSQIVSKEITKH
jgi:phytoene desaturase